MHAGPLEMHLRLVDPAYTDRLAAYLRSLGQLPLVQGASTLDLDGDRAEVEVYVRVWKVLYPEADVELVD